MYCKFKCVVFFIKIRQMKGNFVYNFLIQKYFLNTRSRQSTCLLTNQNAHLITHETKKIQVTKVKICERSVNESDISFESF